MEDNRLWASFYNLKNHGKQPSKPAQRLFHKTPGWNDHDLLDKTILPSFDTLFFEPLYQFIRQQYLANEMEKVGELEANIVSLLHIAPNHNHDFKRITSPQLSTLA